MGRPPVRDRLAVCTYEEGGEEVVSGVPGVTDTERAAAGRQTLSQLWRSVLPANRRRAARQYAAGDLPEGREMQRVWQPRDPAALAARLGGAALTAWSERDVLHVLWRGAADMPRLAGGVQPQLWPVAGAGELWEASVRIRRLDEAVISLAAAPKPAGGGAPPQPDTLVWRGARAPAPRPVAQPLGGTISLHMLDSDDLGAPRAITLYRPPGPAGAGELPGCLLADGQSVPGFAPVLEPAILAGEVPPVLLVGVHNGADPDRPWPDQRAAEYLPGSNSRRFRAHLRFVTGTVIPWAVSEQGARSGRWLAAGFSNGASWAIAAGQRRPDLFAGVAALSPGMVPRQLTAGARAARIRHYLAAGTLEAGFRRAAREWAQRLQRAGLPCRHQEWVGGHDSYWWEQHLPAALAWLLTG